jgi:hypothetical protein
VSDDIWGSLSSCLDSAYVDSYRDLKVWQKSIDLATGIYQLTDNFPAFEKISVAEIHGLSETGTDHFRRPEQGQQQERIAPAALTNR